MEIVDAHGHFGTLAHISSADFGPAPEQLPNWNEVEYHTRVASMNAQNVSWQVMQPVHGYLRPEGIKDTMRVNNDIAAYRDRDPVRFPVAAGTVEPTHGERSMKEIERCKTELKLDGLSWHPRFSGVYMDNKWMWPILRKMSDLGMVALMHANPESQLEAPFRLGRLAREFPEMTFLVYDPFLTYEGTYAALELATNLPNTVWVAGPIFPGYTDGALYSAWGLIESWVKHNGADRIAFGNAVGYSSTVPVTTNRLLSTILSCSLSNADKAAILGGNVKRVFNR